MKSYPTPRNECPHCGYQGDCAGPAAAKYMRAPKLGDISLCLNCAKPAFFTESLSLRAPTPEEKALLSSNPEIIEAQIIHAGIVGDRDLRKGRRQA